MLSRSVIRPGSSVLARALRLSILMLLAPAADGALYRGGGHGLRVEFRVVGKRIVEAKIVSRLRCSERPRKRRFRRLRLEMASRDFPIKVGRGGRFLEPTGPEGPQEEGYFDRELLEGRVSPGKITGRFAYLQVYNTRYRSEDCRTGPFNHAWFLRSSDELSFRATRRHSGR